ncbi:MAG TPA: rhamnogalacturonan acetylesterase [Verrucomicrobiae bacterium]|jgi:lysophospholipase L1-like esterase|nr:rhamnogalacturonan acetylesterase [Verrucomicrobiae bacterium]
MNSKAIFSISAAILFCFVAPVPAANTAPMQFDFGPGKVAPGYTRVLPENIYSRETGFGFEPGATPGAVDRGGSDPLRSDFCASDKPFYFSVALPEGNYKVTVTLGDSEGASTNTIKAELRRLMIENAQTAKGQFITRSFVVNVRTPKIPGDGAVKLKSRERSTEIWAWDEKLTLEFNGARPCVCALKIVRADDVPTVFLLGDSTVCDQPREPWNSWGQMLPRFFNSEIAIANNAESGETLKSSLGAKRLDKVLSAMKPGDYLLIQYGHNDMKDHAPDALEDYKSNLKKFISGARKKGGIPILVTSMERKAGVEHDTLAGYPDAVREVAKEENAALIDLNAMSKILYKSLGTNLDKAFQDGTHHNNYGSYELAKCVVQGIQNDKLGLAKYISDDFKGFDPAHPDSVEQFKMPASPGETGARPLGN